MQHSSTYALWGQGGARLHLSELPIGEHRLSCPECGRGPKDRTLGVTVTHEGAVAHCFRCSHVEHHRDRRSTYRPGKPVIRPVAALKHERLSDYGHQLWDACKPVSGPAQAYLETRRCVVPPEDGDLRWHPALRHPSGYTGPVLVGLITDVLTREPLSLHRTWLLADGSGKANIEPPRLLLGGHRKQGGCIRLWPDEAITTSLAVAEGIETALTVAHVQQPVVSMVDAGNLSGLPTLAGVEHLLIAIDNDPAGIEAAHACAARWQSAGARVSKIQARAHKADINDIVKEAA